MFALSRLTKPFYSVLDAQASKDDRPPKKSFDIETFDTIHSVIERSPLFKRHVLADYAEWTLKPLGLPRSAIEIIQEQMGEDSALLQTFAHRLSSSAQDKFKSHFFEKTRLEVNLHKRSTFSNQLKKFNDVFVGENIEKKTFLDVLLRNLPADFALFMFPMSEQIKSVVCNKEINRRSVFTFFTKAFNGDYLSEDRSVYYYWFPKTKVLIFENGTRDQPYIAFHYATDDFPDTGKGFLITKKITYESEMMQGDRDGMIDGWFILGGPNFGATNWHIDARHLEAYNRENLDIS